MFSKIGRLVGTRFKNGFFLLAAAITFVATSFYDGWTLTPGTYGVESDCAGSKASGKMKLETVIPDAALGATTSPALTSDDSTEPEIAQNWDQEDVKGVSLIDSGIGEDPTVFGFPANTFVKSREGFAKSTDGSRRCEGKLFYIAEGSNTSVLSPGDTIVFVCFDANNSVDCTISATFESSLEASAAGSVISEPGSVN